MRSLSGPILCLLAAAGLAQTGEDPQLTAARNELARLQGLIQSGVLPRARLAGAQQAVADAEDAAFLRKTAYGQDLTVDQADGMVAAAHRRLERRQKAMDDARRLVAAGAAPEVSLKPLASDLDEEGRECERVESRARLVREWSDMALAEEDLLNKLSAEPPEVTESPATDVYDTYARVETAYREHFGKPMPVSAMGETAVHRALGFDHRGRVDIALHPDQPEGVWLLQYLVAHHIPYFAFRQAVKGKATGAHIHIGPASTKLASGG